MCFFLLIQTFISKAQINSRIKELDSLGQYYWKTASYRRALTHYQEALSLAIKADDEQWQSRIYNYMGNISENKGNFNEAFDYHFKALRLREKNKEQTSIAQSYLNIGITYCSSGQLEKGLEYYFKCLEANKSITKTKKQQTINAHAYYHISTAYRIQKRYEEAESYAKDALKIALKVNEDVIVIDVQNGLGLIATAEQKYESGRVYFEKAYQLATDKKDWLIVTNTLQHLAENYKQGSEFAKAHQYTEKSLLLAQKHELKIEQKNAYQILTDLCVLQKDYYKAYQYQQKFETIKDSIFTLEKSQQINEMTIEYETEKKEQKIEILEKK